MHFGRFRSLCQTFIQNTNKLYDPTNNYPPSNYKHTWTSQISSDKRERTQGIAFLVGECIFWVCLCIQNEIYVVYEGTLLAEVGVISYQHEIYTNVWFKAEIHIGKLFLQLSIPLHPSIIPASSLLSSVPTPMLKDVHVKLFLVQEITLRLLTKTIMELIQMLVRKYFFMNGRVITLIVQRNYCSQD